MVAATAAGALLSRWVPVDRLPFILYFPAMLAATAIAGPGPGVLAIVLGPLLSELAIPHEHTSLIKVGPELVGLSLYAAIGFGMVVLAAHLRHARGSRRCRGRGGRPAQRGAGPGPAGGGPAGPRRAAAGPRLLHAVRGGADRPGHRRGRGLPSDRAQSGAGRDAGACRPAETSRSRRTPPTAFRCASPGPMAPRCPPRSCRCSGRRGPGCRCEAWTWTSTAPTARASRCSSTRRRCSTTTAGRAGPSARSSTSAAGGATPRNSASSPTSRGCSSPRSTTRPPWASWCGWRCRRWPTTRCSTSSTRKVRWCGPGSRTATRRARPSCATRWC